MEKTRKISTIMIVGLFALSVLNSVSAVWIYPDADIYARNFTLNTVTAQNFTYLEIGDTYTNLSWDNSSFFNISYATNVASSASTVQYNGSYTTNITVDVYNLTSSFGSNISYTIITNNSVVDANPVGLSHIGVNSTHRRYYYEYNPSDTLSASDLGPFDVNVSVFMGNTTLNYTGYVLAEDLFNVSGEEGGKTQENYPPINGTADETYVELNGYCNLGVDITNFSADVYADVYAPSGWQINYIYFNFITNNNITDQNVTPTSYTQVNSSYRRYTYDYNPSNTLDEIDMGLFDVNVSVSAENLTHYYINYTLFTDVFTVYELQPIGNVTSSYNSTHHAINMTWGQVVSDYEILRPDGDSTPQELLLYSGTYSTHWEALNDTSQSHYVWNDNGGDVEEDWFTMQNLSVSSGFEITNVTFHATWDGECEGVCHNVYFWFLYENDTGSTIVSDRYRRSSGATGGWQNISWTPNEDWTFDEINNLTFGVRLDDDQSDDVRCCALYAVVEYNTVNYSIADVSGPDAFVVVRSNSSYPSCPSDGYEVQNSTSFYYNTSVDFTTAYFVIFTYNTTTYSYSSSTQMPWGGIVFYCYNESNPTQAINFSLEISNESGTEVYTNTTMTNGDAISFDDIPYGENTIIVISNSSYKIRQYIRDLYINSFYNFSFYIPPHETAGGGGGGGDTPEENETKLYFIQVIDEADEAIPDALIIVYRYINTTDSYEEIGSMLSGGYGYCNIYLIPNTLHKVHANKSGYVNNTQNWITDPDYYGLSYPLIMQLSIETPDFPGGPTFFEAISWNANMGTDGVIYVNFTDSTAQTVYTNITIYENLTLNPFHYDNRSGDYNFTLSVSGANTSRQYQVILELHHTLFGVHTVTDIVWVIIRTVITNTSFFNTLFEANYGGSPGGIGWSNFFAFFVMIAGVFAFGQRNTGVAMLLTGGILMFINVRIGLNVIGTVIPILFIILGVLVQWSRHRKEARG